MGRSKPELVVFPEVATGMGAASVSVFVHCVKSVGFTPHTMIAPDFSTHRAHIFELMATKQVFLALWQGRQGTDATFPSARIIALARYRDLSDPMC